MSDHPSVPAPKRRGPKVRPPWETAVSLRAGLPADRAAWLSRALAALDAARVLGDADDALGVPRGTSQRWLRWLRAEQEAGRLPERAEALPKFTDGAKPGTPCGTPEGRRKAAAATNALRAKRAAGEAPPKAPAKPKRAPKRRPRAKKSTR